MNDPAWATRLLTTLAHDVRTPLNAMMLSLALIEDKHRERFDDEDRDDFATLRAGVRSILDLHEDILQHATQAAGRAGLIETEFALDEALSSCLEVIRPLATNKGLVIALELRASPVIRSDRSMIQQLVGNLLSNAVRYTERGSIVLRSRLDGHGLAIEVEDTGIGIAPDDQGRIFDEYFRVASAKGGHGLGLAMARLTAGLLGGSLTVTSEVGRGSKFTLSLPACIVDSRPSADAIQSQDQHMMSLFDGGGDEHESRPD